MQTIDDLIVGVLFGLAAGDRIGGPVRMALMLAESLGECGVFDATDIRRRYLAWGRGGAFDTGPTVARVLALVQSGLSFEQAAVQADAEACCMTAGCNPAHRCAPLAMCFALDDSRVAQAAITEACLTHKHPLAGDAAAAVACLCRALICGLPWAAALKVAAVGRSPEICSALKRQSGDGLSQGGYAPDALSAAIHFVDTTDSFSDALARAIEFAGPQNYCPVLVGSIGGARWGCSQIDAADLRRHENLLPRLTAAAHVLTNGWHGAGPFPPL